MFAAYPALTGLVPATQLADLPTPVHALAGLDQGWIKRDDLTHHDYGGNKVRKLEFVLAEIRQGNKQHVVTFGATGSNAGVATALMCQREGLACTVLLFEQPDSATVRQNHALMQHLGARLVHCKSLFRTVLAYYLHPARWRADSYFLYAGCSNPVATFAYVNAALELRQQVDAGALPSPQQIYLPVSSSSTLAGLTLGCQLAGLPTQVIGIRVGPAKVGPFDACTAAVVQRQIAAALATLQLAEPSLAPLRPQPPILRDDYYGPGYGEPTPEALAAIGLFQERFGITLEQTYGGKAAAAFLDAHKLAKGPILFWNTYNSRAVAPLLQGRLLTPDTKQPAKEI